MTQNSKRIDTGRMARIGMMSAISALLGFFPEIPMAFFAPWLKLDFSYVPMLLTGFSLGFVPGLIVLAIKNFFQLITTSSGGVGQLADMLIGISMLLPATLIYASRRSLSGALWGMVCGVLLMTVVGLFANLYILLPFFLGDGFTAYMESNPLILWTGVAPFNLVKGAVTCLITFLLYRHLSPFLKRGLKA